MDNKHTSPSNQQTAKKAKSMNGAGDLGASGLMTYFARIGLTGRPRKRHGPLMMVILASLAFALAANAVVAFAAISKLEEPRGP